MRWLVVATFACSAPAAAPVASHPVARPVEAQPAELPDVPEPAHPMDECAYTRIVTCGATAGACAATKPATDPNATEHLRHLSVAETNAARAEHADACCYVEFIATACD